MFTNCFSVRCEFQTAGLHVMNDTTHKVSPITIAFWVMMISATTLGETGGDLLSTTLNFGFGMSTVIFFGLFAFILVVQTALKAYSPFIFWTILVASNSTATTLSDYFVHTVGLGYAKGLLVLAIILACILALWRLTFGSASAAAVTKSKDEIFFWVTVLFANTLGNDLGDLLSDRLGYQSSWLVVAALLTAIVACYRLTNISRSILFWLAFVLARPMGTTLGTLLTKTNENGGFDLGTVGPSFVLLCFLIGCILMTRKYRPDAIGA